MPVSKTNQAAEKKKREEKEAKLRQMHILVRQTGRMLHFVDATLDDSGKKSQHTVSVLRVMQGNPARILQEVQRRLDAGREGEE